MFSITRLNFYKKSVFVLHVALGIVILLEAPQPPKGVCYFARIQFLNGVIKKDYFTILYFFWISMNVV
ncbi:hypothetical protein B0A58_00680 [Flavobacterium branchiophilum NBRC 15030 = ATCC 35035]|nr:hypothetical protein B0A58_00680 [Flavobacterium branchiophilum NBRC 15030 = ATCC 35035]